MPTELRPGAGGFVSRRWYSATRNAAVLPVPGLGLARDILPRERNGQSNCLHGRGTDETGIA